MKALTTKELAERLGCTAAHLENLRRDDPDRSPPYVRLGRLVRYPENAVTAWLDAHVEGGRL